MGRGLRTALMALVLAGLGAYIYFVESKRDPVSESAEKKDKVFTVDSAKIEELSIKSSTGERTALKKDGGAWKLTAPEPGEADENEIAGITSALSSLEIQRVVDEQPKDLSGFGLAGSPIDVGFRASGESAAKHLLVGEKTATGGDRYAKVADAPRVFLISGFLDSTFDKKPFDLRDKGILRVDRAKVDAIEVVAGTSTTAFKKTGDEWRLTTPLAARADFSGVEGLLSRITTGQMKSIAAPTAADLKTYGLDPPAVTVTLGAGSARSAVSFGGKTPDGTVYGRDASRPLVFTVDDSLVEDMKKPAGDYRPKDLFEFRSFSGNRFEIGRDGATTAFEKQKGKDPNAPEKWVQVQPAKEVGENPIVDFLSKMSNLRAESFVDAVPAGAAQAAVVTTKFADGKKQETVTFFKSGEEIYATRPGEPGAAKVSTTDYNDAIKTADAVK